MVSVISNGKFFLSKGEREILIHNTPNMLKIGDKVQLNSGSMTMTVVELLDADYVRVSWFHDGAVKTDRIHIKALKVIQ